MSCLSNLKSIDKIPHGKLVPVPPRNCTKGQYRLRERCNIITRAATDQYKKAQKLRLAVAQLIEELADELRGCASIKMLEAEADDKICNIVHLIYHAKKYEGIAKDFEFSRRTMEEHWRTGYDDAVRTLNHPEVLQRPDKTEGVRTFDFTKGDR
jgi:NTE family protein